MLFTVNDSCLQTIQCQTCSLDAYDKNHNGILPPV